MKIEQRKGKLTKFKDVKIGQAFLNLDELFIKIKPVEILYNNQALGKKEKRVYDAFDLTNNKLCSFNVDSEVELVDAKVFYKKTRYQYG